MQTNENICNFSHFTEDMAIQFIEYMIIQFTEDAVTQFWNMVTQFTEHMII